MLNFHLKILKDLIRALCQVACCGRRAAPSKQQPLKWVTGTAVIQRFATSDLWHSLKLHFQPWNLSPNVVHFADRWGLFGCCFGEQLHALFILLPDCSVPETFSADLALATTYKRHPYGGCWLRTQSNLVSNCSPSKSHHHPNGTKRCAPAAPRPGGAAFQFHKCVSTSCAWLKI